MVFTTYPPKFYLPIIFSLADLLSKSNPPMFSLPKCYWAVLCQSFLPPMYCAIGRQVGGATMGILSLPYTYHCSIECLANQVWCSIQTIHYLCHDHHHWNIFYISIRLAVSACKSIMYILYFTKQFF